MKPLQATDPPAVGEFRLLGRLGAGGMGRVYLGVTRSGRPVAVKVINEEVAADPAFRGRFVREVAAARQVGGFWTASVVAADPAAERPWLATEYVPGPSLQQAVAGAGPLPAGAVRVVAARLAEALAAIHAAGLVHRDLKPGNVLLAPDGPVVIDFGIARAFATGTAGHTAVIGTPSYMAPEQIRGEALSPATDVFALGGTLVFAARGRGPFNTGPPEGLIFRVVAEPADLAGVPDGLRELVAACLAKDPADRPGTGQLLQELAVDSGGLVTAYGGWRPPPYDPAAALVDPAGPPLPRPAPLAAPVVPAPLLAGPVVPAPGPGRFVARHLPPGDRLLGLWRRHPAGLLPALAGTGAAAAVCGLLAGYALGVLHAVWFTAIPALLGGAVLGWLVWQVLGWRGSRFVLTDRRVLVVQWGLVTPRVAGLSLSRIAGVQHRQPPLGRLLGYGTLRFVATGPEPELRRVRHLPDPAELHRQVVAARDARRAAAARSGC